MTKVSIIIPTYNEEACICEVLDSLKELNPQPFEIIIVDGGSHDDTCKLVTAYNSKFLKSPLRGRAAQMHLGAIEARGDILCFLHADTFPPKDLINIVDDTLSQEKVVLGGFRSIMKGDCDQKMTTFHNRIKTYYAPFIYNPYKTLFKGLRLLFGDQLMFCTRKDYLESGGFDPEMMIMEEADLCIKMNKLGRIKQIKEKVESSDRRVAKWGVVKSNLIFIAIASLWAVGYPNQRLARFYTNIR